MKCSGSQPWYFYNQVMTCVAFVALEIRWKNWRKSRIWRVPAKPLRMPPSSGCPTGDKKKTRKPGLHDGRGGWCSIFMIRDERLVDEWWCVFGGRGRLGYNSVVLDFYTQIQYTVFIVYAAYTMASLRLRHPNKRYLSNQSQLYDYRIICLIFSISECFFSSKCVSLHVFWDKASHYGPSPIPNQMSNESKNPWLLGVI